MHTYILTRGIERFTRRFVEDLSDIYFTRTNNKTGKVIGKIGVGVREVKIFEVVYPKGGKKALKGIMEKIGQRHKWMAYKILGHKKDKFIKGVEFL